jgi:MFS family permease
MGAVLPARREARVLLLAVLLATLGQGAVLPYLYVYLTKVRGFDPVLAGAVGAWVGLCGLLLAGPAGSLVDRYGARRVFFGLDLLYAAGVVGYGRVHVPWQAFCVATLACLGTAPLLGAYNTLLASAAEDDEQLHLFAVAFATLNLGLGLGGLMGGWLADAARPQTFVRLYLIDGLLLVLAGGLVLALRGIGNKQEQLDDKAPGSYRQVLADRPFRRFLLLGVVLTSCTYAQLEFGLPAFAVDVAHTGTRALAWAFAVNSVVVVVAQLLVAPRLGGRRRTTLLAVAALVTGCAWLLLGTGSVVPGLAAAGVFACAAVFALGEVAMAPVTPAVTNALASEALRGRYNALSSMVFGATALVGPLTSAPLIGHGLGWVWLVLVVGGCLVAAALARALRQHLTPEQDGRPGTVEERVSQPGGGAAPP